MWNVLGRSNLSLRVRVSLGKSANYLSSTCLKETKSIKVHEVEVRGHASLKYLQYNMTFAAYAGVREARRPSLGADALLICCRPLWSWRQVS